MEAALTMSDYYSKALIDLRPDLKIKVAMKPLLIDLLQPPAGGFMNPAEEQSVRNADNPMGELITILLSKGDEEFNIFCDMLKRSNHSAWADRLREKAQRYRTKNQTNDRKAVVPFVPPEYDVEEADRYYLEKALKKYFKDKLDVFKLKKDLYRHTYICVEHILEANAQHFRHMVRIAELTTEDEKDARALTTTRTVAELLDKLRIKTKWEDTDILSEIVFCLPEEPRKLAMSLLKRYDGYLEVYDKSVPAQVSLEKQLAVPEMTESQVPVEVTVSKCLAEFMTKDCKDIVNLLLHDSCKIPRSKIMATAIEPGSTKVVFLIDKSFTENVIHSSRKVSSLWAFQELSVTRVRFSDFELNVVRLWTQHFKEALHSGLTGSMDFVGATKALPYQVYALVDPDISERMVIQTVYRKIAQPCPEQGELVSGTADSEGVETTPEMYEDNFPSKVEEEAEHDDEGKIKEATDSGDMLSRVQELEDELKNSEWKRMDLTQENMALGNHLKVCQEQKDHTEQENASLKKRLVSVLSSKYEDNFPSKVEEEAEHDDEGKIKEATDSGDMLSRVQELEDELKNSEWKRMDLTQENMALRNHLKVCQKQKDHTEQENASLKKRLVSVLSSKGGTDKDSALTVPSDGPLKRIPHRWWLKAFAGSYDTSLLLSSSMKQAEGSREMEGEVVFRRDTKSNLLKPVSGTEWMYQKGALERGRRANLRRHQFTRYHRRWLADNVQKEEEDSCKLWLLQSSPHVGSVREREEHGTDEGKMSEEDTGSGGQLSRVLELEDKLKDSERKRMNLIQSNTALQKILKACREQEVCLRQEIARLGGATASSKAPLKRIPHRWWLKVFAGSYDTSLLPSSCIEQAEGGREMEGEVVFRRDTKSNLLKAVSGTEWMYRRRNLERGRRHQFTRYHQSWLADNVQKEEEESCKQWLLQSSPDVGSVREGEEQGLMSKVYKQALRDYQEKIAGDLIVQTILSDLEPYLTKVEYLQVGNKLGNMAQVDELFRILLTKENRHFKAFCHVLEDNGYQHWAHQLRSSSDGGETEDAEKLTKGSHTIAGIKLRVTKGEVPSTLQLKQAITCHSTYSTPPLQPPSHVMPQPVTQSVRPVPRPRTEKPTSSLRTGEVSILSVAAQDLSLATPVGQAEESISDRSRPDSVPVYAGSPVQDSFQSQSTPLRPESITSASLNPMSSVVRVVGVLPEWDEDMLTLAFDDEDEGGGEIEENGIHISGNEALITFKDPEVAQRVTQKESWQICEVQVKVLPVQHKCDGAQGMVEKCCPDTTIVIEGIPKDVNEEYLKLYLEKVTKLEEGEFALYHKETVAVMVLLGEAAENLDSTVMRILSAKKQLKNTKLKASRLTPVLSVLVTKISNEACKEDKLTLYFKNVKKSDGGRLQGVKVRAKGEAIVTFQEPEGVKGVLARDHTRQLGDEVELQVYHPILSLWSGTVDQPKRAKTEKKSAIFHELPRAWYEHIHQKSNLMQVVNDQLSDMKLSAKAKLDASRAAVCIEPTAGSEFDEEWSSQCTDILEQTLSTITEASVQIPEDVAGKVFPVILYNVTHPNVSITLSDNQDHVSIIGDRLDADHLKATVERIINSNLDTTKDVQLPVSVLVYSDVCIRQRLEADHPNVIFRVSLSEGMMYITGKSAGCEKFMKDVESLQPVEVVPKLSKEVVQLLFMPNGKQLLQSKLVQHEAVSFFFTVEDGTIPHDDVTPMQSLHVVGPTLQTLQGVANDLEKCCAVTNLKVPDEFENTQHLKSWTEMERLIEKQYIALLIPAVEMRQIQLVCDVINVDVITRKIMSFIERECFAEECIPVERGQWEYMNEVAPKDWNKESFLIENSGIQYKFPQAQDDVLIFRLKGETTPVRKHAAAIKSIIGNIVKEKIEVARPGTVKHFLSEEGRLKLKGVGYTRKAVVEVSTLDEEKEGAVLMEQAAQPSHRTVCSGVIAGNKRVEVMVGDLTEYPVDVIVNAANANLQHIGGLASLICRKGGDIVQRESARYIAQHGPLDVGQAVLMTGVGNLHCKAVVHAVGPVWQNGSQNEEAYLARAVEGSLSKAQKYTSIGLPAISSGIYGVPLDVCARAMFTGITKFFQKNPKCEIKVIIMLYSDKDVGPFDNIVNQYLQNVSRPQRPASSTTTASKQGQVHEELTVPTELSPASGPRRPAFSLAQKMSSALVLQKGALEDQAVDVCVNTAASSLDLKNGAVANSLRVAGGPKLQEECTQYTQANGDVKVWQFATTRGHNLKCKHVIHTVGDNYDGQGGTSEKNMKTMIHKVLEECDRLKASSVAFPALGTGNLGFPDDVVADVMVTTVNAYLEQQKGKTCVKKVVFVIFLDKIHNAFKKVMGRDAVAPQLSLPGLQVQPTHRAMGNVWGVVAFSGSTPFSQEHGPSRSTKHAHSGLSYPPGQGPLVRDTESTVLIILVYAGSQEIVQDVVEHIRKLIDELCVTDEVENALVDALSTVVERNLQDYAKQLHVKLSIDRAPFNKIKVQGDRVDVSTIKAAIMEWFSDLEMEQKRFTQADLLTSTIQWQWKDSQGQFQDYDPVVNLEIEEAHREGSARVVVTTEEGPKEIDIQNKTEFSQQPPFTNTEVRRRDLDQERQDYEREKQEGEKPKTWDPMPIDPKTGKEFLCCVVDLKQASPEYKEVEQAFSRTMGVAGGFPSGMLTPYQGIVKIQRIQNQKLYSQYIARKRVIDKANPEGHKNEETLFHGCDGSVTNAINHEGLNRSYAGKNATALGRGVYFARDASYSASDTYTPRDANGHKHMYYARVLTGQYAKGDRTLLVPPPKDPSNPSVLHESVVDNVQNPRMFVVFQDAHVYPEYLITFH